MPDKRIVGIDFGTSTSVVRVKNYNVSGEGASEKWTSQEKDVTSTNSVTFNGGAVMVPTLVQKIDDSAVYYGYDAAVRKKGQTLYQNFKMSLRERTAKAQRLLPRSSSVISTKPIRISVTAVIWVIPILMRKL